MNKESRGFEKTARAARPPARVPSFPTERGAVFHCPGHRSAPRRHRGRGLGSPGGVMTSRRMLPGPVRCGGRDPHPRPASAAAAMAAAHQRDPQRGQLCYTCSAFRCFFFLILVSQKQRELCCFVILVPFLGGPSFSTMSHSSDFCHFPIAVNN